MLHRAPNSIKEENEAAAELRRRGRGSVLRETRLKAASEGVTARETWEGGRLVVGVVEQGGCDRQLAQGGRRGLRQRTGANKKERKKQLGVCRSRQARVG